MGRRNLNEEEILKAVSDAKHILDELVKARVLGGYAMIPFGVQVDKQIHEGHTIWFIHSELDELVSGINKVDVTPDPKKKN